jgi:hypothetical protein
MTTCVWVCTALQCLRKFIVAVVKVFRPEYLRLPNYQDTAKFLAISESRCFPSMLGSIDCMHWGRKIVLLVGMACIEVKKGAYNYI